MEVAAERIEAWKAVAARVGSRTAVEFAKAWYPDLRLVQLATFRQEAGPELEAVRDELAKRVVAIAK